MRLSYSDGDLEGELFTQSSARFRLAPATEGENAERIFIRVVLDETETEMMVDTGAGNSVCPPDLAEVIDLGATFIEDSTYNIRGEKWRGSVYRYPVRILADEACGDSVEFDLNLFVPHPSPGQHWQMPLVLGVIGGLDRIRFAFDIQNDTFYFGPQ